MPSVTQFLIALPASMVAASLFTIWLATRSPNPMVVDDYSRIARSTEQRRERVESSLERMFERYPPK